MPDDEPLILDRIVHSGRIDFYIGSRLRSQREILCMSQQALGEKLGVAEREIQKYEDGTTPIEPSRLFDLSEVLKVRISYFFSGKELM